MPHSSGGGSRSSGSFSGSSGSRGSGGSGSSKNVRSRPELSSEYQSGYHRYVYYHDSRPEYFYSSEPITKKDTRISPLTILFRLFLIALGALLMWAFISDWFHSPKKLPLDYDKTDTQIYDKADFLSEADKALLTETFQEFQDMTGITPALLTVRDKDWDFHYSEFSVFAFETYVTMYSDESHWLFCYSGNPEAEFDNWSWEGMQGDDTDNVLTERTTQRFTENVQKYLYARERYTIGEAFAQGLQDLMPDVMNNTFEPDYEEILYTLIYFFGLIVLPVYATVSQMRRISELKGKENAVRCPSDRGEVEEDTCAYCGGLYVHGIHFRCPHCGAPVPPSGES